MRLIDADAMKESFETNCKEINNFMMDLIDSQPTAYDVNKVVEQLEEQTEELVNYYMASTVSDIAEEFINIVKRGGKDE